MPIKQTQKAMVDHEQDNTILVGRSCSNTTGNKRQSNKIFIGFPDSRYDLLANPIGKSRHHACLVDEEDAIWLAAALLKELYGEPDDDVQYWIDSIKDMIVLQDAFGKGAPKESK